MASQAIQSGDPLSILREIERKARHVGIELPRQEEMQGYWNGVVFAVEGARLALPTTDMSEILTVPQCTRVPGVKPWVRGIANVRGTLMPVFDLREFLVPGTGERAITDVSAVVIDYDGINVGLIVDEVLGMRHIPEENVTENVPDDAPDWLKPFLSGHAYHDDQSYLIFSITELVASNEFLDVAA